jgi:hypothetical protein
VLLDRQRKVTARRDADDRAESDGGGVGKRKIW